MVYTPEPPSGIDHCHYAEGDVASEWSAASRRPVGASMEFFTKQSLQDRIDYTAEAALGLGRGILAISLIGRESKRSGNGRAIVTITVPDNTRGPRAVCSQSNVAM